MGNAMIPTQRLMVTCEVIKPIELPQYIGSMLRGAWGHALRAAACVTGKPACTDCPVRANCAYGQTFEPILPAKSSAHGSLQKSAAAYVFNPPSLGARGYAVGAEIEFSITLLGPAIMHRAAIEAALKNAVDKLHAPGVTTQSLRAKKITVAPVDDVWVKDPIKKLLESNSNSANCTLHFYFPLRIQKNGSIIRRAEQLSARDVTVASIKRVAQIRETLLGHSCQDIAFKDLALRSESLSITTNMYWQELSRFSNRQGQSIPLGGLLGDIHLSGDLDPFLPFLRATQSLHIGKETSFGLGAYSLQETL
jgi:CRISPR-associated endoribonuclease Cas6